MPNKTITSITDTQKFVVTQSNSLIEAEYSTELTARAHKTARLILSLISPDDKDLRFYTIRLDALKRYLGISPNTRWGSFYKELDGIADKLDKKPIRIPNAEGGYISCLLYTSPSPRDRTRSRMPSSA